MDIQMLLMMTRQWEADGTCLPRPAIHPSIHPSSLADEAI
jgi:hypothetical protein